MRSIKLLLVSGALALGAFGFAGISTAAADVCVFHPVDPSGACTYNNNFSIQVCDAQVDGHQVRAWYYLTYDPSEVYYTAWAPSGGCIHETKWSPLNRIRVCVEEEGCSGWIETGS